MPKINTGNTAFTLTEVVIAVVLMLLALGLLLSGFVSSKSSVALTQTHLNAMQIARNEAERLQTNTYDDIESTSAILTNALVVYTMTNSVVSVTNASGSKYKNITTVVEWNAAASSRGQVLTNYMTICNPD